MKKDTVLVVGAAGWQNVGDDLIADALAKWVVVNNAKVKVVGGPHNKAVEGSSSLALTGRLIDRIKIIFAILNSKYVIIGGGGILDDRYPNFYRPFTRVARLCYGLRRKYAFVGIGVGPIQNLYTMKHYKEAAQRADRVLVRDSASRDRLLSCGITREVEIVSDPVLWASGHTLLAPVYDLAINLRRWHSDKSPRTGYSGPEDRVVLQAVIEAVNSEYGSEAHIALISMSGESGDDEVALLEQLHEKLRARITPVYSHKPEDVLTAIRSSRKILSMRLHVCLIGVRYGIPVVGLSYDPKIEAQSSIHNFRSLPLDADFEGAAQITEALQGTKLSTAVTTAPRAIW